MNLQDLVNKILSYCTVPASLLLFSPYNAASRSISEWELYNEAVGAVAAASSGAHTTAVGIFDLAAVFGGMSVDALSPCLASPTTTRT
jgi:hypothetical protein